MPNASFIRICAWSALLLLAVPLALRLAVLLGTSPTHLADVVEFIYDDGYYYLGIAANLADTGHSTLDGLTATNGYQPLWLLCLAALGKLVGTNVWTFFVASCALIYAVAVAAPLVSAFCWRKSWHPIAMSLSAGLCVVIIQQPSIFLQGLEPILFAPVLLPLLILIERGAQRRREWLWMSVLLALAFLVRLDSLAIFFSTVFVMSVMQIIRSHSASPTLAAALKTGLTIAGRLCIVVVPVVAGYLLINRWLFASAVPVSGLAKLIGGPTFSNWGVAWMFFDHWRSLALLIGILVLVELLVRRALQPATIFYRSIAIIGMSMLVQCAYYCSLSSWNVWPWYSYLVAVLMALLVARIVYLCSLISVGPRLRIVAWIPVGMLAIWAGNRSLSFILESLPSRSAAAETTFNQASLKMLADFFPDTGAKTLVAMGDRAGGLAYWGRDRLAVVQMEGLTLDMGYIRARLANRAASYLQDSFPIRYLIVDREYLPQVATATGEKNYVVADPIQGRVTTGEVPTFCFPQDAVVYENAYAAVNGINRRLAFEFDKRVTCPVAALDLLRGVERGQGLRQFSVPSEYLPGAKSGMNKGREDADRARARSRSN